MVDSIQNELCRAQNWILIEQCLDYSAWPGTHQETKECPKCGTSSTHVCHILVKTSPGCTRETRLVTPYSSDILLAATPEMATYTHILQKYAEHILISALHTSLQQQNIRSKTTQYNYTELFKTLYTISNIYSTKYMIEAQNKIYKDAANHKFWIQHPNICSSCSAQ